jgi:hypothetical protein
LWPGAVLFVWWNWSGFGSAVQNLGSRLVSLPFYLWKFLRGRIDKRGGRGGGGNPTPQLLKKWSIDWYKSAIVRCDIRQSSYIQLYHSNTQ